MLYRFLLCFSFLIAFELQGCPCGCGAVVPLALQPGENFKYQLTLSQARNVGLINADSSQGFDDGPKSRETATFAFAKGISTSLSAALDLPFSRNQHFDESHSSVGDPSLGLRYLANPFDFSRAYLPQTAFTASYKHALSEGPETAMGKAPHSLAIHGNGFREMSLGVDFVLEWMPFLFGAAQSFVYRQKNTGSSITPGQIYLTNFSTGYTYPGIGQILVTAEQEWKTKDQNEDGQIPQSDSLKRWIQGSISFRVGDKKTATATIRSSALSFVQKNSPSTEMLSLSFLHAI